MKPCLSSGRSDALPFTDVLSVGPLFHDFPRKLIFSSMSNRKMQSDWSSILILLRKRVHAWGRCAVSRTILRVATKKTCVLQLTFNKVLVK